MNVNNLLKAFHSTCFRVRIREGDYMSRLEDILQATNLRMGEQGQKPPTIAVLGPPCSGKSKVLEYFAKH